MGLSRTLVLLRMERTTRRAARQRRRRLEREIASFATPAQRQELLQMLASSPDLATQEVRGVLDRVVAGERFGRLGGRPGRQCGMRPALGPDRC